MMHIFGNFALTTNQTFGNDDVLRGCRHVFLLSHGGL